MDAAEVQALVNAAVAAALAEAVAGLAMAPPAGPAGPIEIDFARTPAQANTGTLNYATSEGMTIYNAAVAPLSTRYSGNTSDMHIFLKSIGKRGKLFGWKNILNIPTATEVRDLTEQHGLVTLDEIRNHAQVYEVARGRDAQNASQMYDFLESSISDNTKLMVLSDFADYTIITPDGSQICNGPMFLKVIIRNTTVDTRSTVYHLKENFNHLDTKMLEVTYDIEAFNIYVTSQIEQLAARGETPDFLINLFTAYMAVPDKKFVEYLEKQKDKFDDGEDVTVKRLMQVALTKFKDRKRSDTWQAPTPQDEEIMALSAEIVELKKARPTQAAGGKGAKSGKKGDDAKKSYKARMAEKYAWKLVPPASGEPKTKEVNKKTYHFCPHHNNDAGAWVIHHPNKCDRRENKGADTASIKGKAMSLTKVLQAIQEEANDVSSDEESDE